MFIYSIYSVSSIIRILIISLKFQKPCGNCKTMKWCRSNCQNHEEHREESFDYRKEAGYFKAYNDRYNIHPTSSFRSTMELDD